MSRLPPLVLERKLESRLWGGNGLGAWLGLVAPPPNLAEIWAVYDENAVAGGPFAGMALAEVTRQQGATLLGHRVFARYGARFPLLAKLIDAADKLSVQVHPDDVHARRLEGDASAFGKTEAWYVLHAQEGADVILGFEASIERAHLATAVADGTLLAKLRRVPVAAGDALLVAAGTVHAINAGIVLFEIQQRSDLTYRVYDYDRRDASGKLRTLHLEKALEVIDCSAAPPRKAGAAETGGPGRRSLVCCEHFTLERWDLATTAEASTSPETFEILAAIEGELCLRWSDGVLPLCRGDAVILPASLGAYALEPVGPAAVLRCDVP